MIDINDSDNPELYYNLKKSYEFCSSIADETLLKPTEYHIIWSGKFDRKQSLPIKSFFATQNFKIAKLNLWSDEDLKNNNYLNPFKDLINFRKWNPIEEAKGTILENFKSLTATDGKFWLNSDLFRLLCLHKYGGVYFDMDVVLLRDFAPLLNQEFMYKWGAEKNMINGAIMHLFKGSQLTKDLLSCLQGISPSPNSHCWDRDLYTHVRNNNKNWTIFPSAFFNTEWQATSEDVKEYPGLAEGFKPFQKCNTTHLFEKAFSWHWHNRWGESIEIGSKWQILEEIIEKKLASIGFDI
jgi:hypothetical protein